MRVTGYQLANESCDDLLDHTSTKKMRSECPGVPIVSFKFVHEENSPSWTKREELSSGKVEGLGLHLKLRVWETP